MFGFLSIVLAIISIVCFIIRDSGRSKRRHTSTTNNNNYHYNNEEESIPITNTNELNPLEKQSYLIGKAIEQDSRFAVYTKRFKIENNFLLFMLGERMGYFDPHKNIIAFVLKENETEKPPSENLLRQHIEILTLYNKRIEELRVTDISRKRAFICDLDLETGDIYALGPGNTQNVVYKFNIELTLNILDDILHTF